ncbi:MAG: hypothetical protein ACI32N_05295 [Bulleidia sp.]
MKKVFSKVLSLLMALTLAFMYLPGTVSHAEGEVIEGDGSIVSKTATALTDEKTTDVTLEVNGAEENAKYAVLFLLDKSTSSGTTRTEAAKMLDYLQGMIHSDIMYDVVIFSGTATASGWKSVSDATDLEEVKMNFLNGTTTGGTNILAGIYKAEEELADLGEEYKGYTYLITISDGITYVWNDSVMNPDGTVSPDGDGAVQAVLVDQVADGGLNHHLNNTTTTWDIIHGGIKPEISLTSIYGSYDNFLAAMPAKISNTNPYVYDYYDSEGNVISYDSTEEEDRSKAVSVIKGDEKTAEALYASGQEMAMYYSTYAYKQLASKFTEVYTLPMNEVTPNDDGSFTDKTDWDNYPCGREFMLYLQDTFSTNAGQGTVRDAQSSEIFSSISDQILYTINNAVVTDVIGDDFDLTDLESVKLTIGGTLDKETGILEGGKELEGMITEDNTIVFGDKEYEVDYHPVSDVNERETIEWRINVPVTKADSVHLTYTLKLSTVFEDGTYGEYDADGSEEYDGLKTNEEAVIEYEDSRENENTAVFPEPTVQYVQITERPETPETPEVPEEPEEPEKPATPEIPDTGDSTNIAGYAGIALIAAGIALLTVFEKRRRA